MILIMQKVKHLDLNMGYSQQQKADNHERIVKIAARRFREAGLDGIGVAALMKEAGLTHGGFYAHFESRDDLVLQALVCAFRQDEARIGKALGKREGSVVSRFLDLYLSPAHRDNPGQGCTLSVVTQEAARRSPDVLALCEGQVARYAALLDSGDEGLDPAVVRLAITASVGALMLSRVVGDRQRSDRMLADTRRDMKKLLGV